jgi:hypothetical protein
MSACKTFFIVKLLHRVTKGTVQAHCSTKPVELQGLSCITTVDGVVSLPLTQESFSAGTFRNIIQAEKRNEQVFAMVKK